MNQIQTIVEAMFKIDTIWSVLLRAGVWFTVAVVVMISTDNPDPDRSAKSLKANLGFVAMFLILSGGLVYLLFGYQPA